MRRTLALAKKLITLIGAENPNQSMLRRMPDVRLVTHRARCFNNVDARILNLGGLDGHTQSLHTNSLVYILSLYPSLSLSIAARRRFFSRPKASHKTSILGGSYYVEALNPMQMCDKALAPSRRALAVWPSH